MRSLRTILLALAALAATVLGGASAPAQAASRLVVFGDSYSIPVHSGTRDWPLLLRARGLVGRIDDFARFGATASSGWHINFAQQLQRWRRAGRPLGVTVVYLGFNDIGVNLARSRADYAAGIDELVAAGAASGGNRLLLVDRTTWAAHRCQTVRPSAAFCAGRPRTGTGSSPSRRTTSAPRRWTCSGRSTGCWRIRAGTGSRT